VNSTSRFVPVGVSMEWLGMKYYSRSLPGIDHLQCTVNSTSEIKWDG